VKIGCTICCGTHPLPPKSRHNLRVPLINRFLVPPPVWPPRRDDESVGACIEYAASRDPAGNAVHVVLACVYFAVAGLSTATESIAFVVLVGYAALRGPSVWRTWVPLLHVPAVWALIVFCLWATISLAWSPDPAAGLDMLKSARALLLFPALIPIHRHWRLLLASLLAGLSLQAGLQIMQALGLIAPMAKNLIRHAGLYSHPGHLSTYHAAGLLIAVAWLRETRSAHARMLLVVCMVLMTTGVAIAAGRGAIVALVVAAPALIALLWCRFGAPDTLRVLWSAAIAVLLVGGIVTGFVLMSGSGGLARGATDVQRVADVGSSIGSRLVWWRASLDTFSAHPLTGAGVGGTREELRTNPRIHEAAAARPDLGIEFFAHEHPHSLFVQTPAELGLVGVALLVIAIVTIARAAWQATQRQPLLCGVAAAILMWTIAANFDSLHAAGRTAVLFAMLLSFVINPPRSPRLTV